MEPILTADSNDGQLEELTRRIAERIESLNEGGYPHERTPASRILVVARDGSVRTVVSMMMIRTFCCSMIHGVTP